jgi:hypothetical protein
MLDDGLAVINVRLAAERRCWTDVSWTDGRPEWLTTPRFGI